MLTTKFKPLALSFILSTFVLSSAILVGGGDSSFLQAARASAEQTLKLPIAKKISISELSKYKILSVVVEEDGAQVKYEGVPLRTLLAELLPELNLDAMKDWKKIAAEELVMELKGKDGYPGIATALEVAMNKSGDRFILATHRDGRPIDSGVKLVCKLDEAHARWVHEVVQLRIFGVCASKKK